MRMLIAWATWLLDRVRAQGAAEARNADPTVIWLRREREASEYRQQANVVEQAYLGGRRHVD